MYLQSKLHKPPERLWMKLFGVKGLKTPCGVGVLAYFRWRVVAGMLRDEGGNGLHATIVSGSDPSDWVIQLPALQDISDFWDDSGLFTDATLFVEGVRNSSIQSLIDADTDNVFYSALEAPLEVSLASVSDESSGGNIRIGTDGLVLLSAPQSSSCKDRTTSFIGE